MKGVLGHKVVNRWASGSQNIEKSGEVERNEKKERLEQDCSPLLLVEKAPRGEISYAPVTEIQVRLITCMDLKISRNPYSQVLKKFTQHMRRGN